MGDYLPDPETIDTMPAKTLIPVLQRMRQTIARTIAYRLEYGDTELEREPDDPDEGRPPGWIPRPRRSTTPLRDISLDAAEVNDLDNATASLGPNRRRACSRGTPAISRRSPGSAGRCSTTRPGRRPRKPRGQVQIGMQTARRPARRSSSARPGSTTATRATSSKTASRPVTSSTRRSSCSGSRSTSWPVSGGASSRWAYPARMCSAG